MQRARRAGARQRDGLAVHRIQFRHPAHHHRRAAGARARADRAVALRPASAIASPVVKWAPEVTRLEDLPRIVHRAAKVATTPPTGPVFISLPGDILNAFGA